MIHLKYGCNPHQKHASVSSTAADDDECFTVLSKDSPPGYINLMDALNAWQLVKEVDDTLHLPAATSFKHVSPAGAAVGHTITDAYKKARNGDPLSSFGDFIALSRRCDLKTAEYIKTVVSDGIAAPAYDEDALEILTKKKKGKYVILEMNQHYEPSTTTETREIYGITFTQQRNTIKLNRESLLTRIVTENKEITDSAVLDLILATITCKYTQSNSVGYALDGQMIGIGAGQQSRIGCMELAGKKAMNSTTTTNVSLSSDAFFPFRDNIDCAAKYGVKYLVQTGGSNRDSEVIKAANEYDMVMFFSNIRLFHH